MIVERFMHASIYRATVKIAHIINHIDVNLKAQGQNHADHATPICMCPDYIVLPPVRSITDEVRSVLKLLPVGGRSLNLTPTPSSSDVKLIFMYI
jgi:hypothetical protein